MGFGCGYNGGSLHSVGASVFSVPTAEGIAFTLYGGQSAVNATFVNLDSVGGRRCTFVVQVEGNFYLVFGGARCFIGNQDTALVEFHSAVIVLDNTGNGDGVANSDHIAAFTLQAEALDGLVFLALHSHGNGDVAKVCSISVVNRHDLAGQGVSAGQEAILFYCVSSIYDLSIGHTGHNVQCAVNNVNQCTAVVKLNLVAVVLQGAGNGDGITDGQGCHISGFTG